MLPYTYLPFERVDGYPVNKLCFYIIHQLDVCPLKEATLWSSGGPIKSSFPLHHSPNSHTRYLHSAPLPRPYLPLTTPTPFISYFEYRSPFHPTPFTFYPICLLLNSTLAFAWHLPSLRSSHFPPPPVALSSGLLPFPFTSLFHNLLFTPHHFPFTSFPFSSASTLSSRSFATCSSSSSVHIFTHFPLPFPQNMISCAIRLTDHAMA